jgi:hypothetical protein
MRDDPRWIDVTALFVRGLEPHIAALASHPEMQPRFATYMERLARLRAVLDRDFHEEKITGEDKTVDVVVDIFNRVNSGGTKLSKGDLALAKKCAQWPEARAAMRSHLERWHQDGFAFSLDWLLRNTTAVATSRAEFASLDDVLVDNFKHSLEDSAKYVSLFLDVVAGRLGLDHDRVLMGRYAIPVVARLLHLAGGHFASSAESDRALFWYVHSALWGRFAGSTETVLNQDYETVARAGVDGLIASLERWRGGNLTIDGQDFEGFGKGITVLSAAVHADEGAWGPRLRQRASAAQLHARLPHEPAGAPCLPEGFALCRRISPQPGQLGALYERGRLDLTVEALVVQPQFASLFTDEEIEIAGRRLDQLGYRSGGGTRRN